MGEFTKSSLGFHEHRYHITEFDAGSIETCAVCGAPRNFFTPEDFKCGEEWVNPAYAHEVANKKLSKLF
jgi:hypothetical protein